MYDWLAELLAEATESDVHLAAQGADAAALDALEHDFLVRLPPSYRAFLRRWDGGTLGQLTLFSVAEARRRIDDNYRFLPYPGALVFNDEHFGPYPAPYGFLYGKKPIHFFPFGEPRDSSDAWCLDTARSAGGESPVCFYDHEVVSLDDILRVRYPSFEALIFGTCYDALDDGDDLQFDDDARLTMWQEQIATRLRTLGAVALDGRRSAWSLPPELTPPPTWLNRG